MKKIIARVIYQWLKEEPRRFVKNWFTWSIQRVGPVVWLEHNGIPTWYLVPCDEQKYIFTDLYHWNKGYIIGRYKIFKCLQPPY